MSYKFTITLAHSEPKIYRKVIVPEELTFAAFHRVIQIAMGWQNCHLYVFYLGAPYNSNYIEQRYEDQEDYGIISHEKFDAETIVLRVIFGEGLKKKINYIYDIGDGWSHHISLLKNPKEEVLFPICIEGEGACPPEDCGGLGGYYGMLDILNSKGNTQEKREYREWLGLSAKMNYKEVFKFDLQKVNEDLSRHFTISPLD